MEQDFNNFAKDYRQIHTENVQGISGADSYYFAEYKVKELSRFEKNTPLKLLDLGCGDGATEFFLQQYLPAIEVNAIDVSDRSIEVAVQRNLQNSSFELYDGSEIPFGDNIFDIVFVAGVLHHVSFDKQKQLLSEISRVLKTGGRLYLFEHNPLNPFTKYLVRTCVFDEGVTLLKSKETKKLVTEAGLQIAARNFTIFFPRKNFFKPFLKLEKYLYSVPFGGQYYIRAIKPLLV